MYTSNSCWKSVSVVLCVFFFQAEDGIRDLTVTGVQTCALPISIGASYRCIWPRRQDLVSIAVNREAKHTPQVDALQPGGRNLPDQFRWNDLAAVRPAIQDRLHL